MNSTSQDRYQRNTAGQYNSRGALPEKGSQTPPKNREILPDGNQPATRAQLEAIMDAIENGEYRGGLPPNVTKQQAYEIVAEIHKNRPPEPPTDAQYRLFKELSSKGFLRPMSEDDFYARTKVQASKLISIGKYNETLGRKATDYKPEKNASAEPPRNEREHGEEKQESPAPMTPKQDERIRQLEQNGYLNPLTEKARAEMTKDKARILIFAGKQREASGKKAQPFSRNQAAPSYRQSGPIER